jgi:hypothetical protein
MASFDRNSKRRPELAGVLADHHRNMQIIQPLSRQSKTDEASPIFRHEVDLPRRDFVSCDRQIAFVFSILVINHNDDPPLSDIFDDFFNAVESQNITSLQKLLFNHQ